MAAMLRTIGEIRSRRDVTGHLAVCQDRLSPDVLGGSCYYGSSSKVLDAGLKPAADTIAHPTNPIPPAFIWTMY